ncbi:MAG: malectin domain-containing carbohydrate-binding protein, partial [Kiritimatiellae bacterium]|nr:malectin domain-containing carbohydrate-binding protein [Kiritimatiellia bacterium]
WTGTGSRFLVAMNRHSGKYLWHVEAGQVFLHNAICAGNGKVFCLDVYPPPLLEIYRFTERPPPRPERLLAFEAASGRLLWSREQDVFGTWLGYSPQYDVLLQARRPARDALDGRTANRLAAYRGSDGTRLWDKDVQSYGGPCILHGTRIITQGTDYKGEAWDLLSGQPVMRIHPLSGLPVRWRWQRSYGCGTALASTYLLTFRSGEAGFYDLVCDGGTANLGGFRSGCTPNLVPADGVVAAPDYTRTCTCSYANQCSVGFIHDPDVELWTYNRIHVPTQVIERIGLNLGAPGDRLATNGTLWLEWPFNGSVSPNPAVVAVPDGPRIIRHHMSVVRQGDPAWVAASGVAGLEELRVRLVPEEQEARRYTVRLHLAELENCRPGERIFSVLIQGNHTLENLDIAQLAGGPMRAIVREVRGVTVTNDVVFQFVPVRGEPLLCGIECVAEK